MDPSAVDPVFSKCFELANIMFFYMPINPYRLFLGHVSPRELLTGRAAFAFVLLSQCLVILLYVVAMRNSLVIDGDFVAMVMTFPFLALVLNAMATTICLWIHGPQIGALIRQIHEVFPRTEKGRQQIGSGDLTRNFISLMKVQKYSYVLGVGGLLSFPLIKTLFTFAVRGEWEGQLPLLIWLPFDPSPLPLYPFVYALEIWLLFVGSCILVSSVVTIGAVSVLLCSQLKMVALRFKALRYGHVEGDARAVVELIQLHYWVLDLAAQARQSFSAVLFFTVTLSSVIICTFTFLTVVEENLLANLHYPAMLISFVVFCVIHGYYGQLIADYVRVFGRVFQCLCLSSAVVTPEHGHRRCSVRG